MVRRFLVSASAALAVTSWAAGLQGAESAGQQLQRLFDEAWEFGLVEDPLYATDCGDHRFDDRLPSVTEADYQRRLTSQREFLERWKNIDRAKLSPREQTSYDVFGRLKQDQIAEYEFRTYLLPITNRSGYHIEFPELPSDVPLDDAAAYERYLSRLRDFGRFNDEQIELMRSGIEAGLVLPDVVLAGYEKPVSAQIVDDPTHSALYEPFRRFPATVNADEGRRLAREGQVAIAENVVPAYRRLLVFLRDEYLPAARGPIGVSALPHGRELYQHRVRRFTTLDLTPQQVHDIGLSEVARIHEEMHSAIRASGFEGDFAAFIEFLRTDPRFYFESPEQLMKEVALVLKKIDGELPRLFKTLPRMPYGIKEVPAFIAPATTTAYYHGPSGDGTRGGVYFVNTYDLKSRPLYEIEALSLHEAVPGHHLQIARQQELEGLPAFQRFAGFTAFVEGWGLYAERLGLETGFYQDPYSNFGRLSYEMWRACRLVVDSGMHYFGWTREQAIEYMAANTALTRRNITNEVDRYISWPGQALAYKMGELKIRELRRRAEERLGQRFDLREFHDVVLRQGAVPLTVLERIVDEYIAEEENREER
ncbi:MAG TPA: DUF885 domain-containing protein [Pirellulales bacterium]|nr:DUF885 domain-containing protein [Pirellulales bacterium]